MKTVLIVLVSVLIAALAAGGAVYAYERHQNTTAQSDLQSQINTLKDQLAATPTPSASTASACKPGDLSLAFTTPAGGATAGTYYYNLVFTNKGAVSCTVTGAPIIAALDANSATIGTSTPIQNASNQWTVAPNAAVHSSVGFPNPGNFTAGTCKAMKSLSVSLSGQTGSLAVPNVDQYSSYTASYCGSLNIGDFAVGAN